MINQLGREKSGRQDGGKKKALHQKKVRKHVVRGKKWRGRRFERADTSICPAPKKNGSALVGKHQVVGDKSVKSESANQLGEGPQHASRVVRSKELQGSWQWRRKDSTNNGGGKGRKTTAEGGVLRKKRRKVKGSLFCSQALTRCLRTTWGEGKKRKPRAKSAGGGRPNCSKRKAPKGALHKKRSAERRLGGTVSLSCATPS